MMNAEMYKDFLTQDGGVFDKIRQYFGPETIVRFQEDGAPGHGYDNRNQGRPTKVHDELDMIAKERFIDIFKQPANSPDFNPLDLGIWHSLQKKVREVSFPTPSYANERLIEYLLWEAVKNAWDNLLPHTIFNCWMAKDEMLKESIKEGGGHVTKEVHAGIRQRYGTQLSEI